MHYLSADFAFVFLAFLWLYWLVGVGSGPKAQNTLLLIASYGFYASFDWRFLILLICFSWIILGLAGLVARPDGSRRRWPIVIGILIALCNLGLFKYYNFFRESFGLAFSNTLQANSLPVLDILLPVGISFYTFCGIAYLVEVGRGTQKPAAWLDGCLLFAFFPTLLAGPICRPKDLLPQIANTQSRTIEQPALIGFLILSALIKKVWLASWLADEFVNPVFADPSAYPAIDLIAAAVAYAWQIYFDFSGYTDIVTACALLLGFSVPINFRNPYTAVSLSDFWQRWHISLSSWIRDYVYIPLGGNRRGWWRTQLHILIAMIASGVWHGANTTFIAWGLWLGVGLVLQNVWRRFSTVSLPRQALQLLTFSFVCGGWIIFRSEDLPRAFEYLEGLTNWSQATQSNYLALLISVWLFARAGNLYLAWAEKLQPSIDRLHWGAQAVALSLCVLIIIQLSPSGMPGFIYFGF